jgi:hypothetical protein
MAQAAKAPRENRTITVDFKDGTSYVQLLDDGKAFVGFALAVSPPGAFRAPLVKRSSRSCLTSFYAIAACALMWLGRT